MVLTPWWNRFTEKPYKDYSEWNSNQYLSDILKNKQLKWRASEDILLLTYLLLHKLQKYLKEWLNKTNLKKIHFIWNRVFVLYGKPTICHLRMYLCNLWKFPTLVRLSHKRIITTSFKSKFPNVKNRDKYSRQNYPRSASKKNLLACTSVRD